MVKEIRLTQGQVALVDDDMYDHLIQWKWFARLSMGRWWYAERESQSIGGQHHRIYMHREIMQTPDGLFTDHINSDGLDNRRENLRICTNAENQHNQQKQKRECSSSFKGVSWDKIDKKWQAHIRVNLKQIRLGRFDSEIQAALTYDEAAKEYYGEFAKTNFIEV